MRPGKRVGAGARSFFDCFLLLHGWVTKVIFQKNWRNRGRSGQGSSGKRPLEWTSWSVVKFCMGMPFRSRSHPVPVSFPILVLFQQALFPFPRVLLPIPFRSYQYIFASHKINSCNFDGMHVTNNTQTIVPVVALIARQLHLNQ